MGMAGSGRLGGFVALGGAAARTAGPEGFGLGTTVQAWPSQCSVIVVGKEVQVIPTAQISLAATAATPLRVLLLGLGLGLGTILQACPSQCSIKVPPTLLLPTAQASSAATTVTP